MNEQTDQPAIVGLTGGIGSGKSTVARLFGDLGVHWVDADQVAREVVEPGTPALRQIEAHFGTGILNPDGTLDRAQLRTVVFDHPDQRLWLEKLLHPVIREELVRQLRPAGYPLPYALLVSPLLLETDQQAVCDRVLVVDVPETVQIDRTVIRDGNPRDQVERIMAAQISREDRCARADMIINNNRPIADTARQVAEVHRRFLNELPRVPR